MIEKGYVVATSNGDIKISGKTIDRPNGRIVHAVSIVQDSDQIVILVKNPKEAKRVALAIGRAISLSSFIGSDTPSGINWWDMYIAIMAGLLVAQLFIAVLGHFVR